MGSNDRGFEFSDLAFEVVNYADISGEFVDLEDHPYLTTEALDYARMDWATFVVHYPDGEVSDPRTMIGPWDDIEEFEQSVADWVENGTP